MFTLLNKLSLLGSWEAYPSAFFNVIAGTCLFMVMLPDFMTVIKTKKNFFLPTRFFASLLFASFILLVHACIGCYGVSSAPSGGTKYAKFVMMGVFLIVNFFGTIANYYQLKVKLEICKKAKAHNMSEAEYWEKHIQPTLGTNAK